MQHDALGRIRFVLVVAAILAVATSVSTSRAFAAPATPTVTLDGRPVTPVYQRNGHLLVPFRAPMESIGATVNWSAPTATANMNGAQLVTVNIGDSNALIKGTTHQLSVAPELITNNAFVPVEALADICGAQVTYSVDRNSATIVGCTLANIDAIAATGPSFNIWPWLIGLLVLAGIAWWAWNRSRTTTAYVSNAYAETARPKPPSSNVVSGTVDDYVTRLKTALNQTDGTRRAAFVQQLSQAVRDNRSSIPESVVTSTKAAFDDAAGGSSGAVSSLIDKMAGHPQLLQAAVQKFGNLYPGALGSFFQTATTRL
jgi:hypothetical protein